MADLIGHITSGTAFGSALKNHINDEVRHITKDERKRWNAMVAGNAEISETLSVEFIQHMDNKDVHFTGAQKSKILGDISDLYSLREEVNRIASSQIPESVVKKTVEDYANAHSAGFATKTEVSELTEYVEHAYKGKYVIDKSLFRIGNYENGTFLPNSTRRICADAGYVCKGSIVSIDPNGQYYGIDLWRRKPVAGDAPLSTSGWRNERQYVIDRDAYMTIAVANGNTYATSTNITTNDLVMDIAVFAGNRAYLESEVRNMNLVINNEKDKQSIRAFGNFQHYGLDLNGGFKMSEKFRVSNDDWIHFGRDITLHIKDGFKCGIDVLSNGSVTWSGWKTGTFYIEAGTVFNLQIARTAEIYDVVADVEEFTNAIQINTFISELANKIGIQTTKPYKYFGEQIPSKVHGYDFEKVLTMSYNGSSITSQDIEIFGDYLFVAFSGTEQIMVYNLGDKSLVATMPISTYHGSGMQFSADYYSSGDPFPLLYVGGDTSNKINVVRITNNGTWSATSVKTLFIPFEHGYYASPSLDAKNRILYVYAHSENSAMPSRMIISKWAINEETRNGDGTITPKFLGSCYSATAGTYQGHKYFGGRIYMGVSNTTSPHDSKLVAIDASTGDICTVVDMNPVTSSENEGVCYRISGNDVTWYYSDYFDVFKIKF